MALTVRELIEHLQDLDQNLEVHFSYNYGDYWRTQVAAEVSSVETGHVEHSDYHRMDKVVDLNDREEDDDNSEVREVVILGG